LFQICAALDVAIARKRRLRGLLQLGQGLRCPRVFDKRHPRAFFVPAELARELDFKCVQVFAIDVLPVKSYKSKGFIMDHFLGLKVTLRVCCLGSKAPDKLRDDYFLNVFPALVLLLLKPVLRERSAFWTAQL